MCATIRKRMPGTDMELVRQAVDEVPYIDNPTLEQILESDRLARESVKRGA